MSEQKNAVTSKKNANAINKKNEISEDAPIKKTDLESYLKKDIPMNEIASIGSAQQCQPFFELFKELTRMTLDDFFIKISILLQLSSDREKTSWTPQEITHEFHWLRKDVRKKCIQHLSRSGWLSFIDGAYQITRFGKSILSVLVAMPKDENLGDALGANISSFSLLEMSAKNNDPASNLRMFINELVKIDEDIESTMASKSEYMIRKMNKQVRTQFNVAIRSREYLEKLKSENFRNYRLKQKIHEKLSNFHSRVSQVQRAQNDLVARKIILTDKSLTQHDVSTFLINTSLEKLAEMGKKYISHPISVPDLVPALLMYDTEWQFEKERPQDNRRSWSDDMEFASETDDDVTANNRFLSVITEMDYALQKKETVTLENFVPSENWTSSAFRFSMIAVLEHSELPKGMDIESTESIPKLQIESFHKGLELEVAEINDPTTEVKEITKGIITREKKEEKSG